MLHEIAPRTDLTPGVEILLNSLNPEIPQNWKNQARLAATYFKHLDNNPKYLLPEERALLRQLGSSNKIWGINLRGNKQGLPTWLDNRWLEANGLLYRDTFVESEKTKTVEDSYCSYVNKQGLTENRARNGIYHYFPNVQDYQSSAKGWKSYIDTVSLYSLARNGKLGELLDTFVSLGSSPHHMKLAESDLVLYFSSSVNDFDKVSNVTDSFGASLRGPAQDVVTLLVKDGGILEDEVKYSNDGALGWQNHYELDLDRYSPAGFLKKYLQVCLWAGKNPAKPYETSFVYLIDKEGRAAGIREGARLNAEQLVGYPVVFTTHRLDFKLTRFS